LLDVNSNTVMTGQPVRTWCIELKISRKEMHDDDHTG
jgi:hypothetical protein